MAKPNHICKLSTCQKPYYACGSCVASESWKASACCKEHYVLYVQEVLAEREKTADAKTADAKAADETHESEKKDVTSNEVKSEKKDIGKKSVKVPQGGKALKERK